MNFPRRQCLIWIGFQGLASQIVVLLVQIILLVRGLYTFSHLVTSVADFISLRALSRNKIRASYADYALHRGSRSNDNCIRFRLTGTGYRGRMFRQHIYHHGHPLAVRVAFNYRLVAFTYSDYQPSIRALPIMFEFLLFVLTMVKFHHSLKAGWGHHPIISQFMADGIWAFFLPFRACQFPLKSLANLIDF